MSIHDPAFETFPPGVGGLLKFHLYHTVRRILFELRGGALPDGENFDKTADPYDKTALHRLFTEFGISRSSDFQFTEGENDGLGIVSIINGKLSRGRYPEIAYRFTDETYHGEKVVPGRGQDDCLHSKRTPVRRPSMGLFPSGSQQWFDEARAFPDESLYRDLCILHSN